MNPPHKRFFSSLKQLEKRLKLDHETPPPSPPQSPQPLTETQLTTESSTASPIYFHNHQTNTSSYPTNSIPQEFLSINDINQFQPTPNKPLPQLPNNNLVTSSSQNDTVGDIETMVQLLRLSDNSVKPYEMPEEADDEFYDKIVKVKGPKCKKEVERLDGWIEYFLNNGREPFIMAHLLMAKAAFVGASGGGGDGGYGVEFPSTVDDFLQNDPPCD